MQKIIKRAGLTPWPKLWQNLRATRATELVSEGWPEYKVCKWLEHTKLVAEKHYWQVTDADFDQAATANGNAHRNQQWQPAALPCNPMQGKIATPDDARVCINSHSSTFGGVGDEGLEPPTSTV